MAKRKHVTVAIMTEDRHERRYRGATLKQALTIAEEDVIPKSKWGRRQDCFVKWWPRVKSNNPLKRTGHGAHSGIILDGTLYCAKGSVYGTVYRPHSAPQSRMYRESRAARKKHGYDGLTSCRKSKSRRSCRSPF